MSDRLQDSTAPCHFLAKEYDVQIYYSGRCRRRPRTSDSMCSTLLVPGDLHGCLLRDSSLALIARSRPSTAGVGHAKEPAPTETPGPPSLFSRPSNRCDPANEPSEILDSHRLALGVVCMARDPWIPWQNGEVTLRTPADERVNELLARRTPTPSTEMAVSIHSACTAFAKIDA